MTYGNEGALGWMSSNVPPVSTGNMNLRSFKIHKADSPPPFMRNPRAPAGFVAGILHKSL